MSVPMEAPLANLELPQVVERLVALAKETRRAVAAGDYATVARILDEVREAADLGTGDTTLVLQVAEAFLRAVANADLGTSEKALRAFATRHGSISSQLLAQAASVGIPPAVVVALDHSVRGDLDDLVNVGALRRLSDERIDVRPSLRGVVRDLVEPLAFRLWSRVQEARAHAAYQRHGGPTAAAIIASQVGVAERQAEEHLRIHPLSPQGIEQGARREKPIRSVVFSRREKWLRKVFPETPDAAETTVLPPVAAQDSGASIVAAAATAMEPRTGPSFRDQLAN